MTHGIFLHRNGALIAQEKADPKRHRELCDAVSALSVKHSDGHCKHSPLPNQQPPFAFSEFAVIIHKKQKEYHGSTGVC